MIHTNSPVLTGVDSSSYKKK